jgi:tRNA uridine 5-carboxymethylaminomethyl modification enzyme
VQAKESFLYPRDFESDPEKFRAIGIGHIRDRISFFELLKRPEWNFFRFRESGLFSGDLGSTVEPWIRPFVEESVEVEAKYEGYIRRELELLAKVSAHENRTIPVSFAFSAVSGLSREVVERLEKVRPSTLGQAMRIPGITPAAGALLYVHLEKGPSVSL